jgi:hypothetical protein
MDVVFENPNSCDPRLSLAPTSEAWSCLGLRQVNFPVLPLEGRVPKNSKSGRERTAAASSDLG